ncbi:MAG TPA: hypothetical protein VMJ10_34805 [Kofleriaceae bacterium]|nr:hypothetical protein [Kofleriaceae bacterium]
MRIAIAAVLVACSSAASPTTAPTLEVTSPARGTTSDGTSITVAGTATGGSGALAVTVNGTQVAPAKDGSWSTAIVVPAGLSLIETHATDRAGHDVRDVRAVLAGPLAATDGSQAAPIAVHASPAALTAIGKAMAHAAEGVDYTAAAQGFNPIYDNGGCLGATIDITSVSIGSIDGALVPKSGALATTVTLSNVTVKLHASYKVACIGGSTTITVSASSAVVQGDLGVDVQSGALATSLPDPSVTLNGFDLQVSGVPSEIVDLFDSQVRGGVQNALAGMLKSKVPPLANAQLAGLFAKPYSISVLGHTANVSIAPATVALGGGALDATAQAKLVVPDGAGGTFAPLGATLPADAMAQSQGLGVALAADLVNELFGGLWAAKALDVSVPTAQLAVVASLLDADAATLDVSLDLPPMVTTTSDGQLQLAVGDAEIVVRDGSGAELQRIALSLTTTLVAGPAQGKLALTVGQPTVYADVIDQDANASRPLTDDQVQGIVTGAWGLVSVQANAALANLPMPTLAGIAFGAPTISGDAGFVAADLPLQ